MANGRNSFSMNADLSGVASMMDALVDDVEEAVRPSAQASAQVFYDEAKRNVDALGKKTGNLSASIYQKFVDEQSGRLKSVYRVSWNARKAPHGGLVEHGYLRRYKYYKDEAGNIRPMVRPGMEGKPRPTRHASRAEKDAYYVTLSAPIQVAGKKFMARAYDKLDKAVEAATNELFKRIEKHTGAA